MSRPGGSRQAEMTKFVKFRKFGESDLERNYVRTKLSDREVQGENIEMLSHEGQCVFEW